jgi:hypothetical protein
MKYYKCNNITTVDGEVYNHCVVGIEDIQPSGDAALDRQSIRDDVMTALECSLAGEVESFYNMEELQWE